MNLKEWYRKESLDLFSGFIEPYLHYFEDLKPDLTKANINLSLTEYLSMALMTIVIVFLIEMPIIAFIVGLMPEFTIPMAVFFSLTVSLGVSGLIAFLFYIHPSLKASSRAEKIDHGVPFAATYLATISGSGLHPVEIFKILAEFESYEEIAEESKKIATRVELFGMNITEALTRSAKGSPSERFSDLLWGMITTIRSGTNLYEYLQDKSRKLMREYERDLEEYSDSLGTFLQIYLTLIIVGSIFTVIVTSIMSAFGMGAEMSGMITIIQFSVVFIFLPVITLGFVWLLQTTYPG